MVEQNNPELISRMREYGVSIFTEMTKLAVENDAINLSQGFPDFDGPDFLLDAAHQAIDDGKNQYAPSIGIRPLRDAISQRNDRRYDLDYDPAREVTIFTGATEAVAASIMALVEPGQEVMMFEPYYDLYPPATSLAGGERITIPLEFPDFSLPRDLLEERVSEDTRCLVLNTPMNPTGKVFSRDELQFVSRFCREHDLLLITDEVYEYITFDREDHIPPSSLDGLKDRTVMVSSAAKTFSSTGWKIGWACAPEPLSDAIRNVHQFLTFASARPFQHAVAHAIEKAESMGYYETFRNEYAERRDVLCDALQEAGFEISKPQGTYYVLAEVTSFGFDSDREFCRYITEELGVAAIPVSAFCDHDRERQFVRFAFCKDLETLREASNRLLKLPNIT